jgi:signal transduction histidine kinase
VSINPGQKRELKSIPHVSITELKLFLNKIDWTSPEYSKYYSELIPWTQLPLNPQLPFKLNHLSFTINAIDFSEPEELKCTWYLEGFDTQWSPITKQNIISYSNLSPGKYTLKVKAVNHKNEWSEISSYRFEIVEPLYKSTIFQIILIFSILLAILLVVMLRVKSLKRYKEDLELLVSLKTKEIMQQNAEILTQNKILERQKERIGKTVERLKESYSDLALLNEIGKDISYSLSSLTIIDKVYENLNTLLDAAIFGIGIYKKETNSLEFISSKEKGKVLPAIHLSLEETQKLAVKCLLENKEIFISDFDDEYTKYGKDQMQLVTQQIPSSLFYVPLTIVDRKIGILTVQSYRKYAYDNYHLNLIRNIAIYTGIALVNAETYEQLKDKKQNLETANNFIKEKNKQIEKQNEELKKLNEEKNKLIRIVAHDLRNPLTAGLTSLEVLMKSEKEISTGGFKQFDYLKRSLWRMNEMIEKILDVRAIENNQNNISIEKVNVSPILEDLIHQYEKHAETKLIEFEFSTLEDAPPIFADKSYITQIFDNLISNAVKFSPKNSIISVTESIVGENLRIEIKDQGLGFKEDELKELFKNFKTFSAKPTGTEKSSGIGLSVVKKYIDEMDGKVWCESEFQKGTSFFVEFELIEHFSQNSFEK